MTTAYKKGKLYDLPIIDLKPDPNQPRKSMEPQALEDLAASVKLKGVIQPILFRVGILGHDPNSPELGIVSQDSGHPEPVEGQTLIIVAGERRHTAAQMAGLPTLPGICVEGNPSEIALVENLQRQDLTCIEEAEALQRLMNEEKYTQDQLAGVIGKPRTTINESLSLTNLPQEIRDECRGDRKFSKTKLIEIARKKQQRAMTTAFAKYREDLQKAQATDTKKKERLSAAAALSQTLDKAREKVESANIADWSDDDLQRVHDAVIALQEALDVYMNPPEPEPTSNLA